jgi:hypothetical protein
MNTEITFDPSKPLKVYFRCNRAGQITFVFNYSGGSAYSFIYRELELNIYNFAGEKKKLLSLTIGAGLTVTNNRVRAAVTSSQTNLNEGQYYIELYRPDLEKTWTSGDAIFHNGKFDGVSNTEETIVISEDGDTVNITLDEEESFNTRTSSQPTAAILTPDIDNYDMAVITAQAEALLIANPTGTPVNGNAFVIRIKDEGIAIAITFGNKYRAIGSALPTTTTANKTLYFCFVYNSAEDFYDVFPSQLEQ